jgi:uncharacterized protein (UPF0548 family)
LTEKRPAVGELDYPGIGYTEHGRTPEGYSSAVSRTYIGKGSATYLRVANGILTWELQKRSGLNVRAESDHVVPGARIVSGFGVGPFRLNAPCEVVWVHRPATGEGPQSAGFGYGTLPGHPVKGEEAFEVEMDEQESVFLKITAFSRPSNWLYRVAGVLARAAQRHITSRYIEGARQLAADEI